MRSPLRLLPIFLSGLFCILSASAISADDFERFSPQATGYMNRARQMLKNGNYAGVIDQLKHLHTENLNFSLLDALSPGDKEEYIFMLAQALYQRGDEECVTMLRDFVREFPASPLAVKASLSIGDYYFFNHEWRQALKEYDNCDLDRLNREDYRLYTYRIALSLIKSERYSEARHLLAKIAGDTRYQDAVTFYNAYIDYCEGKTDEAYAGFMQVPADIPGLDAPYYIAQIDFSRGNYDTVIELGKKLLRDSPDPELIPATNRIVGLSFFKKGNYREAKPYLKNYVESEKAPASDVIYALGVIEYDEGDIESALQRFASISDLDSDLGQSAWLYLGQCYLKTGNPDAAAMAFEKASVMSYDATVKETALYNYAAAITRGGNIPFSSSLELLEKFINTYPSSEYTPKVEEYLATAYYNSREYAKALRNIEGIRNPSAKVLAAKQKILYELGIECVTNGKYQDGAHYLQQAVDPKLPSREIASLGRLWLGDALFALMNYKGAAEAYSKAVSGLQPSSNRTLAMYNLAYAQYMKSDYSKAAAEFSRALSATPSLPGALRDDAEIRRADCLYYTGDYISARNLYASALKNGAADSDYAAYRHAVMLGLGNDISGKINELNAMEKRFPNSKWLSTAMLEKAMTLESLGRTADAEKSFREVISRFPEASQARKALMNIALNSFRHGNKEEGAKAYKEIISRWPSSEEADMAHEDLKKYYASTGDLNEYARFLQSVPGGRALNSNELEELAFEGAETAFSDNITNISLLQKYIKDYPDGKYLAQALLDIAISLESAGNYTESEAALTRLISSRPYSPQALEALLMKGDMLENKIQGRKPDALAAYLELEKRGGNEFSAEAVTGIMRTTNNDLQRIEYARRAKTMQGIPAEKIEEASLYEADALLNIGRYSEAEKILSELSANSAGLAGAKASVILAEHYLKIGNYSEAEKTALRFTDNGTPHAYWLAKGFIALADAYHATGKTYLAKEYLQSLRNNYPGNEKDITTAISSRLKEWK